MHVPAAELAAEADVVAADVADRAADAVVRVAADAAALVAAADVTAARVAHATEKADVTADGETVVAAKAAASWSRT